MPTVTTSSGTIKLTVTPQTKTLTIVGGGDPNPSPPPPNLDKDITNPEPWLWDAVSGNAGRPIVVTLTDGVPSQATVS